jgi:hypothetical protein
VNLIQIKENFCQLRLLIYWFDFAGGSNVPHPLSGFSIGSNVRYLVKFAGRRSPSETGTSTVGDCRYCTLSAKHLNARRIFW